MPSYSFHLLDDGKALAAGDNLHFDGPSEALEQAVQAIVEIACDEIPANGMKKALTRIVRSDDGKDQYRVALSFEVTPMKAGLPTRDR